ncbi:hypothetical protein MKW98_011125 [Papaver atlanticum]|uniref:Potassium transporter n=1 Tax=Papaver atlanticum TaxID=357466 RepID=A0AAD4XXQ1_9MAGN|nr:hypothetical protein MKW98_011125 [Papaver atlanticum]
MESETGISSPPSHQLSKRNLLLLVYQSFGVVYGDLSTSPLYVYTSTFVGRLQDHQNEEAIFGAFSLIFWTLTLIPLVKYVLIVLSADDNGEGGTFALYSLLCKHVRFSLLPNRQPADEELSAYGPSTQLAVSSPLKRFLEKHERLGTALLIVVLCGACMVIGDGILTPAISVLSSVSGLATEVKLTEAEINLIACGILVGLFELQRFGTHWVAFLFAPIVIIWLISLFAIGLYNTVYWNPKIVVAMSPHYIIRFFRETGRDGWIALAGILLSITGTEAMFANLGHFTALSIRLAFALVVYPCLVVQYMGQAAFLSKNPSSIPTSFYDSIPSEHCLHNCYVYLNLADGASHCLRMAEKYTYCCRFSSFIWIHRGDLLIFFSHYCSSWRLAAPSSCFDLHNKASLKWLLTLGPSLGIARVPGIGLIYSELTTGIPAVFSHFVTNFPAFHKVLVFVCVKSVPVPYVSPEERFLIGRLGPKSYRVYRCIARYGYKDIHRDHNDFENQIIQSIAEFIQMEADVSQFSNSRTASSGGRTAVISIRSVESTSSLIVTEQLELEINASIQSSESSTFQSLRSVYEEENPCVRRRVRLQLPQSTAMDPSVREELTDLIQAKEAGIVYMAGNSYVKARRSSSFLKKMIIDTGYSFLDKNCRGDSVALNIPHLSLIEVGMIYCV